MNRHLILEHCPEFDVIVFHSREFEGDTHVQPLGEWQRFKYVKFFEMVRSGATGGAADGHLRVDDFLDVLLRRYSSESVASAGGDKSVATAASGMETAVRAFFEAVAAGSDPAGESAASLESLSIDSFLLGLQRLIMERDYDDGLPEAIANLVDARFNLICAISHSVANSSAPGAPSVQKRKKADSISRDAFIREYRLSRDWDATRFRDEYALTVADPTVEGLFLEAKRSIPRTFEPEGDASAAEMGVGGEPAASESLNKSEWTAYQRRWWISNDCWDPINIYP